ncbi:hypothetical protein ANCDUO_05977 [Ancylostoma duodenale]|uniref:Uncharacterized protein n=1 Tax=Ancylostoma duodenale TaxID=51022 RepID=A0A0C2GXC0_9BILA|nr:hypothetical protein ANCDUO_05977 [Ancylostoma duodenale]
MKIDENLSPQLGCAMVANDGFNIFLNIPRGTTPSTDEKAQIRLLNDIELSDQAIRMKIGRTHCPGTSYLHNSDGYSKKKDTSSRNFSQLMTRGRSVSKAPTVACR